MWISNSWLSLFFLIPCVRPSVWITSGDSLQCFVVPLQSWGTSFNFSIWYVELSGIDKEGAVKPAIDWYKQVTEATSNTFCPLSYLIVMYLFLFLLVPKFSLGFYSICFVSKLLFPGISVYDIFKYDVLWNRPTRSVLHRIQKATLKSVDIKSIQPIFIPFWSQRTQMSVQQPPSRNMQWKRWKFCYLYFN